MIVGDEKQKERFVFPTLNDDFFELIHSITEPWVYLKVSTSPDEFIKKIPEKMETAAPRVYDDLFSPDEFSGNKPRRRISVRIF